MTARKAPLDAAALSKSLIEKGYTTIATYGLDDGEIAMMLLRTPKGRRCMLMLTRFSIPSLKSTKRLYRLTAPKAPSELHTTPSLEFDLRVTQVIDTVHMFRSHFVHVRDGATDVYHTQRFSSIARAPGSLGGTAIESAEADDTTIVSSTQVRIIEPEEDATIVFEDADGRPIDEDELSVYGRPHQSSTPRHAAGLSDGDNSPHRGIVGEVVPVVELRPLLKGEVDATIEKKLQQVAEEEKVERQQAAASMERLWTSSMQRMNETIVMLEQEEQTLLDNLKTMGESYGKAKPENRAAIASQMEKAEATSVRYREMVHRLQRATVAHLSYLENV